jgi:hypothetical protein
MSGEDDDEEVIFFCLSIGVGGWVQNEGRGERLHKKGGEGESYSMKGGYRSRSPHILVLVARE